AGAVGLLAAAAGTAQVGVETSRCFVERFDNHADYADAVDSFLKNGTYAPQQPKPIEIPVGPKASAAARKVREQLKGSIYGAVGPRSMQMWNKMPEAALLRGFGMAWARFEIPRLLQMAQRRPPR